mmetsp:Transcript_40648/g.105158  ORF Transcript_40648/g.105158 Transcript_40648/m.105158 type:complete len:523 (+) Transcript_40648:336-1904(+)
MSAAARRIRASKDGLAKPSQSPATLTTCSAFSVAVSHAEESPSAKSARHAWETARRERCTSSATRAKTCSFCSTLTIGSSCGLETTRPRISRCRHRTSLFIFCRSRRVEFLRWAGVSSFSSSLLSVVSPSSFFSFFSFSFSSSSSRPAPLSISRSVCACRCASPRTTAADAEASAASRAMSATPRSVSASAPAAYDDIVTVDETDLSASSMALDRRRSLSDRFAVLRPRSEMTSVQRIRSRVCVTISAVMPLAQRMRSRRGSTSWGVPTAHFATLRVASVTQCALSSRCVPQRRSCGQACLPAIDASSANFATLAHISAPSRAYSAWREIASTGIALMTSAMSASFSALVFLLAAAPTGAPADSALERGGGLKASSSSPSVDDGDEDGSLSQSLVAEAFCGASSTSHSSSAGTLSAAGEMSSSAVSLSDAAFPSLSGASSHALSSLSSSLSGSSSSFGLSLCSAAPDSDLLHTSGAFSSAAAGSVSEARGASGAGCAFFGVHGLWFEPPFLADPPRASKTLS